VKKTKKSKTRYDWREVPEYQPLASTKDIVGNYNPHLGDPSAPDYSSEDNTEGAGNNLIANNQNSLIDRSADAENPSESESMYGDIDEHEESNRDEEDD